MELVQFSDFSGGDEGRSRPSKYDPTKFRATNAWVYPSGGLGPRPPAQKLAITGLPQKKLNVFIVMRGGGDFYYVFAFSDGTIYRAPSATGAAALVGTATNPPCAAATSGDYVFFCSASGTGSYITTSGGLTEAAIPQAQYITFFGARLVVSDPLVGVMRVSAVSDYLTWPAANAIAVGNTNEAVVGLYVQRNTLVLPKRYGSVWVLRGVPTVNETLRQEDQTLPHHLIWRATGGVVGQSNLWYCVNRHMVRFTGAQAFLEERPDVPTKTGYDVFPWSDNVGAVLPLSDDDEFLVVGTMDKTGSAATRQVWFHARRPQDAWTRHILATDEFIVNGSTLSGLTTSAWTGEFVKVDYFLPGTALICTGSDTSGLGGRAPRVYALNSQQEHPYLPVGSQIGPLVTSATLNDGDTSLPVIAEARTAEHWDQEGRQLTVTEIVVDYSYNPNLTPASTYNKFDLTVEALQSPGSTTVNASTSITFTPSGSGSTPDGSPLVRAEQRFGVGNQGSGLGFRVRFADWRGIVVHRIAVFVDATEAQR